MPVFQINPPLAFRVRDVVPSLVVLHATAGGTARSSIDYLRGAGNSYHYIIARDGRDSANSGRSDGSDPVVFHCVPETGHAFHVSSTVPVPGRDGSINKNSIGVSLANIQNRTNPEPYTPKQLTILYDLLRNIKQRNPSVQALTTHAVVQPWNRSDPVGLDGQMIAEEVGLTWWQPLPEVIRAHWPPKQRIA